MFWKKKDGQASRLPGPKDIPEPLKKQLAVNQDIDPDAIPFLKAAMRYGEGRSCDIRIYDPSEAEARNIKVKDYDSLTEIPEMIICEGEYDESTKKAEITSRKSMPRAKLLTMDEILRQIEGMKEPGSSLFFYMAAGPGAGGPLGRGASIIKLNPTNGEKRQKKYSIYGASVIDGKPIGEGLKIFDSDKGKDIAKWLAEAQKPRFV
ncbi:MAG: hypothetical protein PHU23_14415 [Dehalococcoidales bacterium]|nr:hypothetical protein [Dehalococcoidales bacterium]